MQSISPHPQPLSPTGRGEKEVVFNLLSNAVKPGVAEEVWAKFFAPFFTTKAHGTGLGMAIAKRMMEAHGGRIAVGPPRERGAEIVILLPRTSP
jgi:C4-dicarboxylate-specific signal transduction histidine kinase